MKQQHWATRIGRAAEHAAVAWILRNHNVWVAQLPDSASTDLVVFNPDYARAVRIQVKTTFRTDGGRQVVNVSRSDGTRYAPGEVDYVLAVDLDSLVFWVLPIRTVGRFTRVSLGKKYAGYAHSWHDSATIFAKAPSASRGVSS